MRRRKKEIRAVSGGLTSSRSSPDSETDRTRWPRRLPIHCASGSCPLRAAADLCPARKRAGKGENPERWKRCSLQAPREAPLPFRPPDASGGLLANLLSLLRTRPRALPRSRRPGTCVLKAKPPVPTSGRPGGAARSSKPTADRHGRGTAAHPCHRRRRPRVELRLRAALPVAPPSVRRFRRPSRMPGRPGRSGSSRTRLPVLRTG
jgi:hypothetical protein